MPDRDGRDLGTLHPARSSVRRVPVTAGRTPLTENVTAAPVPAACYVPVIMKWLALTFALAVSVLGPFTPAWSQWLSPVDVPQRSPGDLERFDSGIPPIEAPSLFGFLSGMWLDSVPGLGLGVGVQPLHGDRGSTSAALPGAAQALLGPYRLLDDRGTAISFDLRLRWPSPVDLAGAGALQPYVAVGPALFLAEPDVSSQILNSRADTALSLGVRAGAGVTWSFDRTGSFFSEYRFIRGARESNVLGGRNGASEDPGGFDLLYGVRFRF